MAVCGKCCSLCHQCSRKMSRTIKHCLFTSPLLPPPPCLTTSLFSVCSFSLSSMTFLYPVPSHFIRDLHPPVIFPFLMAFSVFSFPLIINLTYKLAHSIAILFLSLLSHHSIVILFPFPTASFLEECYNVGDSKFYS